MDVDGAVTKKVNGPLAKELYDGYHDPHVYIAQRKCLWPGYVMYRLQCIYIYIMVDPRARYKQVDPLPCKHLAARPTPPASPAHCTRVK